MKKSLHIQENLTTSINSIPFFIDETCEWLRVKLRFKQRNNWQRVLLWDPSGKLRMQYLNYNSISERIIHRDANYCSDGTVPGVIEQGKWIIEIFDEPNATLPDECSFIIEYGHHWDGKGINDREWWTISERQILDLRQDMFSEVKQQGPKWYKGDFHTHTTLSDGNMSVEKLTNEAEKKNLDFFAITDHDILPTGWLPTELLIIPGIEITSSKGHFNGIGLKQWIDWRHSNLDGGLESEIGMKRIIAETKKQNALVSINHPMLTECNWDFQETELSTIDSIEIINDPTYPDNPKATMEAIKIWNALLNDGHRITGIGGSDVHMYPTETYEDDGDPSTIGDPCTYVYADQLSVDSVLQAVREGKVYVSRGPKLDIEIHVNGFVGMIGDDISDYLVPGENTVRIEVSLNGMEDGLLACIEMGKDLRVQSLSATNHFIYETKWISGQYNWLRLDVYDSSGNLQAFTNPIFSGKASPQYHTWKQLMDSSKGE